MLFLHLSQYKVFHTFLYEWLIGSGLVNRLLDVKSSYLEPYLRRAAKQADNLPTLDIMWKYVKYLLYKFVSITTKVKTVLGCNSDC